jgi:hypothetical protein
MNRRKLLGETTGGEQTVRDGVIPRQLPNCAVSHEQRAAVPDGRQIKVMSALHSGQQRCRHLLQALFLLLPPDDHLMSVPERLQEFSLHGGPPPCTGGNCRQSWSEQLTRHRTGDLSTAGAPDTVSNDKEPLLWIDNKTVLIAAALRPLQADSCGGGL